MDNDLKEILKRLLRDSDKRATEIDTRYKRDLAFEGGYKSAIAEISEIVCLDAKPNKESEEK